MCLVFTREEEENERRSTHLNNGEWLDNLKYWRKITLYRSNIIMIYYVALGKESGINFITLNMCNQFYNTAF